MDMHKNARLTPLGRAELVRRVLQEGQPRSAVAAAFGVCAKTVGKWVERYQAEGPAGLDDRSSRPHRLREPTAPATCEQIVAPPPHSRIGKQNAAATGLPPARGSP